MKRKTGFVLIAAMALSLALLIIPTSQAERPGKIKVGPNPDTVTAQPLVTSLPAERATVDDGKIRPDAAGLPSILDSRSPLSAAAVFTSIGGVSTSFDEISLLANWDGREDYTADRGQKVDDLSFVAVTPTQFVTREAISEHTKANGFDENVYYEGDSLGNLFVPVDLNPGVNLTNAPSLDAVLYTVNIPTLINTGTSGGVALAGFPVPMTCSSASVVVTGVAVNPVADLSDFPGVACGTLGEVVYVSVQDDPGCGVGLIRTRILAFGFTDNAGGVTQHGALLIDQRSESNSGIAVDDNGSLYAALRQAQNAFILKATELPHPSAVCGAGNRVNRVAVSASFTNYSGFSPTFGNIVAIAAGPSNVIYAAMARSAGSGGGISEGPYTNPVALGPTPSMIISFADRTGALDRCSSPDFTNPALPGVIPVADGIADVAQAGQTLVPGVNNFRVFALGTGPDIRPVAPLTSPIATSSDLKVDMPIDFSIHAGLTVDENGSVYVISGGAPAGSVPDVSPNRGEVLVFPDSSPADRRADFIDLRGNGLPNPPASGGNVGDGDSDRFDHVFWQAPLDPSTTTPAGIAGLARGFLRYTNRLAPNEISPTLTLGKTAGQTTQGDDATTGPIFFENLDPGHQVAGGDDQNTPFRGDDDDGAGVPPIPGALNGGFEFTFFGGPAIPSTPVTATNCVWNGFFLNSNGGISFGAGDTDNTPTVVELRAGLPKIVPAWADMNPNSRAADPRTFPVQALGFADVNAFKVRYIDVPQFGDEICTGTRGQASNGFSLTLFDDGTGIDENANQPLNPANPIGNNAVPFDLQEGPTDLRFVLANPPGGPNPSVIVPAAPRREGSGNFVFNYDRMDLLGTQDQPVIAGYSVGSLSPLNPPGLCQTNLGVAASSADSGALGVIPGAASSIEAGLIGEGTEATIYELYDKGRKGFIDMGSGSIIPSLVYFDLRFEGNDPAASKSAPDPDKGSVGFFGVGCSPPSNPLGLTVTPTLPVAVAPNQPAVGSGNASSQFTSGGVGIASPTSGIINALGAVELNIFGVGFLPNEVTQVCASGVPTGDIPTPRPGKTVSSAVQVIFDTNGDGIPDLPVTLTNITVVNRNLIRATATPLATAPGTPWPLNVKGGLANLTTTTTFTAGDNNLFGPFTRSTTLTVDTGKRAPVVVGATAVQGNCSLQQDVLVSGFGFIPLVGTITGVQAIEEGNTSHVVNATNFNVLNNNLIEAIFNLTPADAGKPFRIYVTSTAASGATQVINTSRNLLATDPKPASVPTGNEQGNLITFSCTTAVNNAISLNASNYNVTEDCTVAAVTINRSLPSNDPVTVDISTIDGTALQKSDYTATFRTISLAAGETSKVVEIPITEDSFNEANETFTVALSNPTGGAGLGGQTAATVTIVNDDNPPPATNAIDDVANFVGQHYHDFLNRQADAAGQAFWASQITSCGANAACIEQRRISVSASFFLSIEFQETGFFVLRSQRAAFGKKSADPATRYTYFAFLKDSQQVSQGVIIGQPGANALLEANKQAYATQVVTSAPFIAAYPLAQTAAQYVDALFATAAVVPTLAERSAAITAFGAGGTAGRVAAFRSVVDANSLRTAESNPAFVLMEYFGYLRRNPTDAPDNNDVGYQFWLTKLNTFGGNFIDAEMVKAFLSSMEYRQRFGTP